MPVKRVPQFKVTRRHYLGQEDAPTLVFLGKGVKKCCLAGFHYSTQLVEILNYILSFQAKIRH